MTGWKRESVLAIRDFSGPKRKRYTNKKKNVLPDRGGTALYRQQPVDDIGQGGTVL